MKYSVIIPIYNGAATIGRCLDSLLRQQRRDAEILLINDGSTDESGEICQRYGQLYDCVRYYEKENGGVSSARNLGLEHASGKYILFVDSDDYVSRDYFSAIDGAMTRWDPDMLIFQLKCFGERNDVWQTEGFISNDSFQIADFVRKTSRAYLYSNLMTRSFRRDIILANRLRFEENLFIGEDQAFIFAYTMYVKSMVSIENVLYHYAQENSNSLSRRIRPYLTGQLIQVNQLMQAALQDSDHPEPVRRVYQEVVSWSHYRSAYSACKELSKFHLPASERRMQIRQICKRFRNAEIPPVGFRTWLIALPVLGKMSRVIDGMSCYREYRRKHSK